MSNFREAKFRRWVFFLLLVSSCLDLVFFLTTFQQSLIFHLQTFRNLIKKEIKNEKGYALNNTDYWPKIEKVFLTSNTFLELFSILPKHNDAGVHLSYHNYFNFYEIKDK